MTLRFSTNGSMQALARGVGGFGAVLFFHKFCAIGLTITFLTHLVDIGYRIVAKREWSLLWGPNSMRRAGRISRTS